MRVLAALGVGLCLWVFERPVHASAVEFPAAFAHEAPRVRAALERAFITEQSGRQFGGPQLAYLEFCEAARMGSAEGHYRAALAALTAMEVTVQEARWALFHLQSAEELGHVHAGQAMLQHAGRLRDQVLNTPPDCLVAPPDLTALRAARTPTEAELPAFDFDKYARRLPGDRKTVLELVRKLASESTLSVDFVMAIAAVESNFNSMARSPKDAMGVMQLIPATAARFGVKDPYDPAQNIRGGIKYLEWLYRRFKGDLKLVAAAYNSGEGSVDRYKGIPPFAETQMYVKKIFQYSVPAKPTQK